MKRLEYGEAATIMDQMLDGFSSEIPDIQVRSATELQAWAFHFVDALAALGVDAEHISAFFMVHPDDPPQQYDRAFSAIFREALRRERQDATPPPPLGDLDDSCF